MSELKTCPFCGSGASLEHGRKAMSKDYSYVRCKVCGASTWRFSVKPDRASDKVAIEAWNRRVGDE